MQRGWFVYSHHPLHVLPFFFPLTPFVLHSHLDIEMLTLFEDFYLIADAKSEFYTY